MAQSTIARLNSLDFILCNSESPESRDEVTHHG
jgi:hypothetical protein